MNSNDWTDSKAVDTTASLYRLTLGDRSPSATCTRWGTATTVKPGTVILHSRADDVVPFSDSEELVRNSGLPLESLIVVGTDHRLAEPEPLAGMAMACERAGKPPISQEGYVCHTCGQFHAELPMDFGADAPAPYYAIPEEERASRCDLTTDLCVIDGSNMPVRENDLMTELEWLASHEPWRMLKVVERSKPSDRKVRLFNAAVCRQFWDYLPEASQAILSESELPADGLLQVSSDELCWRANAAVAPIDRQYPTKQFPNAEVRIQRYAAVAVCYAVISNDLWGAAAALDEIDSTAKQSHSTIIRDVFGNPFRSSDLHSAWLTPKVRVLAEQIYDDRTFERLPALAERLATAGCENDDVLAHCSHGGQHVRGCWVVDLILGRK
jgi:Uncharacterized protein conserved in bacteria (DUF2199)